MFINMYRPYEINKENVLKVHLDFPGILHHLQEREGVMTLTFDPPCVSDSCSINACLRVCVYLVKHFVWSLTTPPLGGQNVF